ncbi:hypothetical protein D3C71_1275730 [compost metagenome]
MGSGIIAHQVLQLLCGSAGTCSVPKLVAAQRSRVQRAHTPGGGQGCKTGTLRLGNPLAQGVHAGVGQYPGTRCNHGVFQGRWHCGRCGSLSGRKARMHVCHALGGQRVAAQIWPRTVVVEPVGLLELVEHADKALRCKPGGGHQAIANAVRLALHVARKVQLVLHGQRLPPHHQRLRGARILAGRQRAQNHRPQQQGRLLALLGDEARDVALGDVAELVGQHRGQLVAGGNDPDQAKVHAQIAARQRKRVHRAVAPQQDLPREALIQLWRELPTRLGGSHQRAPDTLHIVGNDGVVDVVGVSVKFADDAVTQATLGAGGEVAGVAEGGQGRLGTRHWCVQNAVCYKKYSC